MENLHHISEIPICSFNLQVFQVTYQPCTAEITGSNKATAGDNAHLKKTAKLKSEETTFLWRPCWSEPEVFNSTLNLLDPIPPTSATDVGVLRLKQGSWQERYKLTDERDRGDQERREGRRKDAEPNRRRKTHVTPLNLELCADELILLEFVS